MTKKSVELEEAKVLAEQDLYYFIRLVAPHRVLGDVHKEVISWMTRQGRKSHQLILLPRAHQKSALMAYYAAWRITTNPAITILYISATSTLAEKQLRAIKHIIDSPRYKQLWPDMLDKEEGRREEWTTTKICVDHPKRKKEGVRDSTIQTGGITTNITGLHCDLCILDDLVVPENADTEEGRRKVAELYSYLSSIENPESDQIAVGTRYHAKDLYSVIIGMKQENFDKDGEVIGEENVYEIFERVLEDSPGRDGTGQYLWPRQRRTDGQYFGFNRGVRSKKYATYVDKAKFFAQYYNDPTDPSSTRINTDIFQYYDKKFLNNDRGKWYFKDVPLEIYAGMDFAWSLAKRSDYTAIVVVGVSPDNDIYVLDIDRFKTDQVSNMWKQLLQMHMKWDIKKVRAETNMGQKIIVEQFKEYAKNEGSTIRIDDVYRTRHEGTKLERNTAILEPRYNNRQIWHYRGYNCQVLEEELTSNFPEHDDVEDAFASAVEIAKGRQSRNNYYQPEDNLIYHGKFGGIVA